MSSLLDMLGYFQVSGKEDLMGLQQALTVYFGLICIVALQWILMVVEY